MIKDTPKEVIEVLRCMLDADKDWEVEPSKIPDHELFKTGCWSAMLRMDSYYYDADAH